MKFGFAAIAALFAFGAAQGAHAADGQKYDPFKPFAAKNMKMVGYNDLGGVGKGGEGLALRQYPDGRRILFLAHESGPACFSVVDVTDPAKPVLVAQTRVEEKFVRCNSLGVQGTTMVVAHQTAKQGQPYAGMDVWDIADYRNPKKIAHLDQSGPYSRGSHFVSFTDPHWVYETGSAPGFVPRYNASSMPDDQIFVIIDMSDRLHPKEAGRWWLPGTEASDKEPAPPRVSTFNNGIRPHSIIVEPEMPDTAFIGWIDGGFVILDISDRAHPKLITHDSFISMDHGFAHTLLPIFDKKIMIMSDESVADNCADWPKRNWVWDMHDIKHPYPLAIFPTAPNKDQLCRMGGRFGAHNINMNRPNYPWERSLHNTVVGAYFNAGIRINSLEDPSNPVEIGYLIPPPPPANKTHAIEINDIYVDEHGVIYANDRLEGGLYIMKYTGKQKLD